MYFSDWRVLLRRWYAVVLGLLLTAGLGCTAVVLVPVQYKVEAEVLLLPPKKAVLQGGNPYLYLDGLTGIQDVLSRTMSDAVTGRALAKAGATGAQSIVPDPLSAGPVLVVGVEDSSQEDALRSLRVVLDRIPVALRDIQTSTQVPEGWMVTSTVITEDDRAQVIRKTQLRAVVVGIAVGLAATVLGSCLLDSFLLRRGRRRKGSQRGAASPASPEPSEPTGGRPAVG
jgi:uncharacterized protein involved in exopolysaccharide biosynthesis